jgi:hypothetical protein
MVTKPAMLCLTVGLAAGLGACANSGEPERRPAAITITQPAEDKPAKDKPGESNEAEAEAQADAICRQSDDGDAALVERYENERRGSEVSSYNCVGE